MNRKERRRQRKRVRGGGMDPAANALYDQAVQRLDAGQPADAVTLLRQAVGADPFFAEALHLLGMLEYQAGRLEEAGDLILRAAELDETNPVYHANCGAVLNLLGRAAEAEAASRHVIDLVPGHAEAHNNLSVALDQQGRTDEALVACRRAIELKPDYAEAYINLGNMRFRQGLVDDAVAAYREAVRLAPANAMARANLAAALRRQGALDEAAAVAREAIRRNPTYAEAHNNLGNVRKDQGDLPAAVAAFQEAIRLRPAYLDAHLNLGAALYGLGRMAEAEAAYRRIIDMGPKVAEARRGLGVVLMAVGQTAAAIECFREAVRLKPAYAEAYYDLASSGTDLGEGEIATITEFLAHPDLKPEAAVPLHFALGETLDRKGQAEVAFTHFAQGNAKRRALLAAQGVAFDPAAHDRFVDDIARVFDGSFFAARKSLGCDSEAPVFVVGLPRAGTTLVEQIAASHPAVTGIGETDLGARLARSVAGFPSGAAALDRGAVARLAEETFASLTSSPNTATRVIEKTPANFLYLGLLALLFPRARVVHCRRDARDVAVSCYFQNFAAPLAWSTDLADIARYVRAYRRLMAHWQEALPLTMLTVDYERLVADPVAESRRLVDFLGLPWDDACLRFHEARRIVRTASSWQVRRPIYTGSVGRWRAYASHLVGLERDLGENAR